MTPDYNYSIVTKHKWLWPLIDIAALIVYTISDIVTKSEARAAAKCNAAHCNHHN